MKVSVIIPAHNEEANIGDCLECLVNQILPKDQFEVIVVDNVSTDSTVAVAKTFADKLDLKVVSTAKRSISGVRNDGAATASGEILAFLDADCLASETWLQEAFRQAPDRSIWGAHYLIPEDASWVSRVWFVYQATSYDGPSRFLPAGDLLIRRKDFDQIGGFDESVQTSEDVDICLRASRAGMKVVAISALAVVHKGSPGTLGDFYRQNRWHGKQVLRVFLLNLPSLQNVHIVAISIYTLALFWATIAAIVAAFVWHLWFLPPLCLALLLLPPLIFSLYRAVGSRNATGVVQLWILYTTYLLARAAAIARPSNHLKST